MCTKNKITLLIVDDELMIRKGLKNSIDWHDLNIEVVGTAENGLVAYQLICKLKPDIVITDIKMPVCDGLELIKKVRHEQLQTKFIIISGFDDFEYAQKAIEYKVLNYLLKPIKKSILFNNLQEIVNTTLEEKYQDIQNSESKKQMQLGKEALKDNFFSNLIDNAYTKSEDLDSLIQYLDIKLIDQPITLALFEYDLPNKIFSHQLSKEDNTLFKFSFKNILSEVLHDNVYEVFQPKKNQIVVIFSVLKTHNNNVLNPINFCKEMIQIIHSHMGVNIIASIGTMVQDLFQLHQSYNQAVQLLSYKMYDSENKMTVYDQSLFHNTTDGMLTNPYNYSTAIINAIIDNDIDLLRRELYVFFKSLLYIPKPPPSYVRGMCNYFIIDISKKLSNTFDCNDLLTDVPQNYINTIERFEDIKNWILNQLIRYSDIVLQIKKDQSNLPILLAKQYVTTNITNKILIRDVASYVNLSESYFAAMFKKVIGINFRTYVLNSKIDYAMEKLKTSNMSIGEIATALGYDDYRSFNRMFKKATGKTPSQIVRKE